jgi:hypothetical protein
MLFGIMLWLTRINLLSEGRIYSSGIGRYLAIMPTAEFL